MARLERIGTLAAELCYADDCPASDNICVGSCAAVCPDSKYLRAASRQIFAEYWASRRQALTNHSDLTEGKK